MDGGKREKKTLMVRSVFFNQMRRRRYMSDGRNDTIRIITRQSEDGLGIWNKKKKPHYEPAA